MKPKRISNLLQFRDFLGLGFGYPKTISKQKLNRIEKQNKPKYQTNNLRKSFKGLLPS